MLREQAMKVQSLLGIIKPWFFLHSRSICLVNPDSRVMIQLLKRGTTPEPRSSIVGAVMMVEWHTTWHIERHCKLRRCPLGRRKLLKKINKLQETRRQNWINFSQLFAPSGNLVFALIESKQTSEWLYNRVSQFFFMLSSYPPCNQ